MHRLVLAMLIAVTTVDYLTHADRWGRGGWLPREVGYLPEVLSMLALIGVIAVGARLRFRDVPAAYWLLFGSTVIVMAAGAIAGGSGAGEIFSGVRMYFRAMPFFFVPLVFRFSDDEIRAQLKTLLLLGLLQVPIAIEQRWMTTAASRGINFSGDYTYGTLMLSSTLSIFVICCICVVTAFFVKNRLNWRQFVALALLLFVPSTINETKVTLFLFPIGLSVVFLLGLRRGFRVKAVAWLVLATVVAGAGFWIAYDLLGSNATGRERTLADWWVDEDKRTALLTRETELGTQEKSGRLDSITVPIRYLSNDVVSLTMGLGVGSVTDSALGPQFIGRYRELFAPFMRTAFPRLLLETGILGLLLVAAICVRIFYDARQVERAHGTGIVNSLALGWTGVVAVMTVSIFYTDIVAVTSLSYLFWYGSGLVVSGRRHDPEVVS